MTHEVLRQEWLESERGWGTRPDGYSLHVDHQALWLFVAAYWAAMPDETPDEYSRPCGEPERIPADDATFAELVEAGGSLRLF